MLRLGVLLAVFLDVVCSSCPSGFTLEWHGICTELYYSKVDLYYNVAHNYAVSACAPVTPILIRNQEEQDYWTSIAKSAGYPIILAVGPCSTTSGTWLLKSSGVWEYSSSSSSDTYFTVYCMEDLATIDPYDDECSNFEDDSDDGVCYQVGIKAETWSDAQTICRSYAGNVASIHNAQATHENSFIRRLAVSRGEVNGILLGATIMGKSNNFSWIDGTPWDYDNFYPGFPVDGVGSCIALDTSNVNGRWVNVECDAGLSFACEKREGAAESICSEEMPKEEEIIYSPGFPANASIPCEYFLTVGANKLVEILQFEANACCDKLVLTEGSIGGKTIATVTGFVNHGTKYRTTSSNMMRALWQPNGGVNVQGMMITFRGVDPSS